ncbi:MAG: YncE family protein [Bacteroidota bacterium]
MKRIAHIALSLILMVAFQANAQNYYVYVTAESEDEVGLVKFDGKQAETIERIPVGKWPTEIEGPHGIAVSLDGKHWFLSMAHGNPYGTLYKYSTETNEIVGETQLGLFPATMQVSKATGLLYVVNFNLHGDMVPSTISVVDPVTMTEIKQVTAGVMPHGSRISHDGLYQYSVGMMSGDLLELNTVTLNVDRKLKLDEQSKMEGHSGMDHGQMDHSKMDHSKMDHDKMKHDGMFHSKVKPTWAIPHPDGKRVYVAGNGSDEILEIDLESWKVAGKLPGGKGPYNVEISPNGELLIVTYKSEGTTGIWNLKEKKELARIKNSRRVSHGVAISTDNKYAFISVEGIGGEPGAVDVISLTDFELIDTAELGKQAGGIAFWKIEQQ